MHCNRFLIRKDRFNWIHSRQWRENTIATPFRRSSQQVCLTTDEKKLELLSLVLTLRIADFLFNTCFLRSFTLSFTYLRKTKVKKQIVFLGSERMRRNCSYLMRLMFSGWAALKIVNEAFIYHVMQESVRGKIYFKGHKRLNSAKVSINLFVQKIRKK
jgi:hypothetical protein